MEYQKSILIIDDEKDLAQMIQKRLKSRGYDPIVVHNGIDGLKILKNIQPDLIILDLNMPGMGGVEFYKNICDEESNPRFPIFVLTGRGEAGPFFRDMKVAGFMAKPFKFSQLFQKIDAILKKEN